MVLLALMVLQNTATVLVGRYTRSGGGGDLYVVNHLIVVCEATKVRGESALLRWFGAPSFLTYIYIYESTLFMYRRCPTICTCESPPNRPSLSLNACPLPPFPKISSSPP